MATAYKLTTEWVRPREAAARLGMSRVALWRHIQRGNIPANRIGRLLYIDMQEVEETLRRNKA